MPVFHTKTIESILEPVAQQVSKLVILHEEAEDGNAMPDLARPVQAVKMAVDNLVKVGYETITNSEDAFLKHDMPPALNRVEEASLLLLDASGMLRDDPYSAPARKKLIEGSRGILQGTSALLLAFDESEVRKIIRICKNVLEYLAITEVVDSMSDLVTFVKNLSPILTRMTKEVDAREKELTHQVHRQWLIRSLDQVKTLTPVLISAIKIYLTTRDVGGHGLQEAQANRDYTVAKMSDEIHEIIRVLQLTTYDEDEWDADDMTVMKKAQNAIDGKMKLANDWLLDSHALVGSSGERCLRQILEDATKVAERCVNPEDRDSINKLVSDISSMADALCELRQQGKGNSPQAMSLARGVQEKLRELQDKVNTAVVNTDKSGIRKPAHTMSGKAEQAQRWLANPGRDDHGLGEESTRLMIAEGRRAAEGLHGARKAELQRACDEVEILTNQLSDLCHRGMGDTAQARAVAANLSQKLHSLKNRIQDALTTVVADDFLDITTPLKQLSDAAFAPYGTPGREGNFEDKARRFDNHANSLSTAARMAARAGKSTNKDTIEGIQDMSNQVDDLTPQVIKAARIVMLNPENQAAAEHFELLKKQWTENVERLRNLVDEVVDTAAFVKAQEEGILRDTEHAELAIKGNDAIGVVNHTSSIARRANRVLQVAQQEAENSEDPQFVDRVNEASRQLRNTITPMVQSAKALAHDPRNPSAHNQWRGANQRLIDAVGDVRSAVTIENEPDYSAPRAYAGTPDMSGLSITGGSYRHGRSESRIDVDIEDVSSQKSYSGYRSDFSGYRSDSPISPYRAQDIRGELRGRGRSESPHFRIGTPVILDLEDLSGSSLDRRRPVRPSSHSPDIRGELRGRGRSESPHYRIGTPVILDLEDIGVGSLDRRRVRRSSYSPENRVYSMSAQGSYNAGAPYILDLEDLTGDLIDRKVIGGTTVTPAAGRGGPDNRIFRPASCSPLPQRRVMSAQGSRALGSDTRGSDTRGSGTKSPFTVGERCNIDLNALAGGNFGENKAKAAPLSSSRGPRSLLGGRRTVRTGEPIDIDLEDILRKNSQNKDPSGSKQTSYMNPRLSSQANMGVTPDNRFLIDPKHRKPGGPPSPPLRKKKVTRPSPPPPPVPPPPAVESPIQRQDVNDVLMELQGKFNSHAPLAPPPYVVPRNRAPPHPNHRAPPRPPLPRDTAPPRPPPPETDDEEEQAVFSRPPQENQPIMMAAHALHMDVKEWSSRDNDIIGAAKRMAILMAKLSQLVRGEGGSKKDLIDVAKRIAESSEEVTRLAKLLAKECTDKRMRLGLLQVCERIPTIGTQLKILSTVKATMLGAQGSEEDQEATEMLVGNAQNLMQSVRETVRAAQAASIKIRVDSGYSICWTRKRPWYT